jgi:hypothetical protein
VAISPFTNGLLAMGSAPLQMPFAPPFQAGGTPPVPVAGAASAGIGNGFGASGGMTLFSAWLLLAAAWRALSFAARARPLGIRLPELSPPG